MKDNAELRSLTVDELKSEILSLRKHQFNLRMKKANGTLDKLNLLSQVRRAIARVKTIMTEKMRVDNAK